MKDHDFDFDTSELLSSLDKLKAKYSFNFDDEEDSAPEIEDEPAPAVEEEPVISIAIDEPEEEEVAVEVTPAVEDIPEEQDIIIEKETPAATDMSWLIDSDKPNDEPEQPEEEPIIVPEPEEDIAQEEPEEVNPVIEQEPVQQSPATAWYLTMDEPAEEESDP